MNGVAPPNGVIEKHNMEGWIPIRRGQVFCSRLCGAGCTWESYNTANDEGLLLVQLLGHEWRLSVWENLGWHWQVSFKRFAVWRLTDAKLYMCQYGHSNHSATNTDAKQAIALCAESVKTSAESLIASANNDLKYSRDVIKTLSR